MLALPDPRRSLLAAQIVYTLKQVGGVKGVVIKVNQQPFRVPGIDPNNPVIAVEAILETWTPSRWWPVSRSTRSKVGQSRR